VFWLRALTVYPLTVLLLRFIGRGLQFHSRPYDVAVQILLGSAAAELIFFVDIPVWKAFVSLGVLALVHTAVTLVSLWNPAKNFLEGQPRVLMENGRILRANLILHQISVEELMSSLREKGYPDPADVEFAILEPSGRLSVIPRSQARPVTPRDLHLDTAYEGVSSTLIADGTVFRQNLKKCGLSEDWLHAELRSRGITELGEVLFASLDTVGQLFVVRNQDVPFMQALFHGVQAQTSPGFPPRASHLH
jgi:uncharacterized membrane protein YcaP (DUF421 family)